MRGLEQLSIANIAYTHLQGEFIDLALILDTWNGGCTGWALDRHWDAALAM